MEKEEKNAFALVADEEKGQREELLAPPSRPKGDEKRSKTRLLSIQFLLVAREPLVQPAS